MNIAFWGVYESNYPRNKVFVEQLQLRKDVNVSVYHVPLFEKEKDKSGSYLGALNLLKTGFELLFAYMRLSFSYLKNRRKIDLWICGYIGQSDVIVLNILQKLLFDKTPILFNTLLSLYDTIVLDRGKYNERSIISRIIFYLDKLAFSAADSLIIDTEQHKKYLMQTFNTPANKVHVIPVIADPLFFQDQPSLPELGNGPFKLQLVGKFIPLYGLEFIIEAAKILEEENIVFEFIGGGQLEEWFKTEIERLGLKNILLKGWVSFENLPAEMAKAHVSLGIFDPGSKSQRVIPNKVFQSLAMGKITLTADSPAIREIAQYESILFLVPPGSGKALAEKIVHIRNKYPALKPMSEKAAEYSRNFYHPKVLSDNLMEIIKSIV